MRKKRKRHKKSTAYRFLKIDRVSREFERCIICESMGENIDAEVPSYPCLLFGGESICRTCCTFEIDCGRGDEELLTTICSHLNMIETDIYNRCMICQYSNKNNIYSFAIDDFHKPCYFMDVQGVEEDEIVTLDNIQDKKVFCKLFNRFCRYSGNALECEHSAWSNDTLLYIKYMVERELMLRNVEFDSDFDIGYDDDEDY